jgi:uncharacterized linocin/CFP29 family protein
MNATLEAGATVESGRALFHGATGKWAGERFLQAIRNDRPISPAELRTNDVLRNDDWSFFDSELIEEASIRLRGVADLIERGLTKRIPNGLAKTVLEYETVSDMDPANVSLDGVTRSENDRVDFNMLGLPLPIIHKDFYLNLRALLASRSGDTPLDTIHVRAAGRKIAEMAEQLLFQGFPNKTFVNRNLYGYTTHPSRNTASFGTNGHWGAAAKTGENIITDISTMMAALEGDRMFGPYMVYVPASASTKFNEDFKSNSDKTIRQRVLEIDGISGVRVVDQLPTQNVVMVQLTSDVVQWVIGEDLQNIQWDFAGGMQINFKAFTIQVPLIRADAQGRSGIFHMA